MIELMFLEVLMLVIQVRQLFVKSALFVIISIFEIMDLRFNHLPDMTVVIYK